MRIQEWNTNSPEELEMLAELLHAVVHAGGSVSFILPFPMEESRAFWRDKILPGVTVGTRRVLVAYSEDRIVGTVQLDFGLPPNQRHRADVAKMLVHPSARRRGIARALMMALEDIARLECHTLLTLDTVTGGAAEPLYLSMGYVPVGVIPRYARKALTPELESTSIMYKELAQR
jgi:GNAT superfamily N-acetyltransferase